MAKICKSVTNTLMCTCFATLKGLKGRMYNMKAINQPEKLILLASYNKVVLGKGIIMLESQTSFKKGVRAAFVEYLALLACL